MKTTKIDAWIFLNKDAISDMKNDRGKNLYCGEVYFCEQKAKIEFKERNSSFLVLKKIKITIE